MQGVDVPQRHRYNAFLSVCLGATQVTIGAISCLTQFAAIGVHTKLYEVGHGIWCGAFFIIAGSFGIRAGKTQGRGFIVTFMVLSIVAASIFVPSVITVSSLALYRQRNELVYASCFDMKCGSRFAMNSLLIVLAFFQCIAAIVSSSLCCGHLCSFGENREIVNTQAQQVQYMMSTSNGQQVAILTIPSNTQSQYFLQLGNSVQQLAQPQSYSSGQAAVQPSVSVNPPPYSPSLVDTPRLQGVGTSCNQRQIPNVCSNQVHGGRLSHHQQTAGNPRNHKISTV